MSSDIPDDYLRAIGMVVVEWNYLEEILNLALITTLGMDPNMGHPHIIFTHMAFPQKLDVLSALIAEFDDLPAEHALSRYRKDIQPLLKEAQQLRNGIVHSPWWSEGGLITRTTVSARGQLKWNKANVQLQEVELASVKIQLASIALGSLVLANREMQDDSRTTGSI